MGYKGYKEHKGYMEHMGYKGFSPDGALFFFFFLLTLLFLEFLFLAYSASSLSMFSALRNTPFFRALAMYLSMVSPLQRYNFFINLYLYLVLFLSVFLDSNLLTVVSFCETEVSSDVSIAGVSSGLLSLLVLSRGVITPVGFTPLTPVMEKLLLICGSLV